ncbi:WhiB family transcriptional regulator (plasmid) [Mycolicibacterium psychrotolerans]|uniref:WhiB family transcriptional regulator n=1 Tax=Mycolicibacterium psychrotolerans TaxID=216929 RepID=UPI003D678CAA
MSHADHDPAVLPDLPCQAEPDRWFDRDDRSRALIGCLACPVRGWCAREALRSKACWGMWAGVWIDGDHRDATDYLRAAAEAPPAPLPRSSARRRTNHPVPQRPYAPAPARALIAARSSGHCEVMLDGCHYTGDVLLSRITGRPEPHSPTAAHGFLACDPCRSRLEQPGRIATLELGYRLHSPRRCTRLPSFGAKPVGPYWIRAAGCWTRTPKPPLPRPQTASRLNRG